MLNKPFKKIFKTKNAGFTVVELLVVLLIIGLLSTLLVITYTGIQEREHNNTRIADIKLISASLENYYAENGQYPTLADMNSQSWRTINLKATNIDNDDLKDPISKAQEPQFSATPTRTEYAYQPTASNGTTACDNKTIACAKYTLTATMQGGTATYVVKSLN
jgi:prepilin-type N-terminal cleavage/methylation domain-containing protein